MKHYTIQIEVQDNFLFAHTNRHKEVDDFIKAFKDNNKAKEIKVFERNGVSYSLAYRETRKTIGF